MNALLWAVTALIVLACIYAIAHDDTTPRRTRTPPRHSGRTGAQTIDTTGLPEGYTPPVASLDPPSEPRRDDDQ